MPVFAALVCVSSTFADDTSAYSSSIVIEESLDELDNMIVIVDDSDSSGASTNPAYALAITGDGYLKKLNKDISYTFNNGYVDAITIGAGAKLDYVTEDTTITVERETTGTSSSNSTGIYVDGGTLGEMAGDIVLTNAAGDSAGLETYNGGYFGEMSGSITVNHLGASGSYATGVWINGMEAYGTESSAGIISGSITVNGGAAYTYGVYLNGNTDTSPGVECWKIAANNQLDSIADTSEIRVTSTTGTATGIMNSYSNVDYVGGTISATSETGAVYAIDNWGSMGEVSASITAIRTGTGTSYCAGLFNRGWGTPATIDVVTSTILATNVNGQCMGIYNVGNITSIDADVTASASGSGYTISLYNLGASGTSYYGINYVQGSYTATAYSGTAAGVYNCCMIDSIDAIISATSTSGMAYGVRNVDYFSSKTSTIGSIAGSITVNAGTAAYGIQNAKVVGDVSASVTVTAGTNAHGINSSSSIGDISGDVDVTAKGSYAMGVRNSGSTVGNITGDITVNAYTSAYGIYSTAGDVGDIDSTIIVDSQTSSATGVYNYGDSMGTVLGAITVNGYSAAYGINNYADMGDVNADIKASATKASGEAFGIYLGASSSIGTIGGSITVTGDWSYGIYTESSAAINFAGGTSITSTNSYDDAYSLYSTAGELTIKVDGVLNLTGNIDVNDGSYTETETGTSYATGNGALTIGSGEVSLSSGSTIAASTLTISEGATLSLTIAGDYTLTSESLTFSNLGTLNLTAGAELVDDQKYAISADTTSDFSGDSAGNVVAYGGTVEGDYFIVSETQNLVLDDSTSSGVTTKVKNARVVVSNKDEDTSIVMNFNASSGVTISAVTTVTELTEIKLTIDEDGTLTETSVNSLDSSFAVFVEETMSSDLTIVAAEAYYFAVSDLAVGESVELIFDVGEGYDISQFTVYHLSEGETEWSVDDTITTISYDGQYLSAIVTGFSSFGYTITKSATADVVPEPSTATLSLLALAGLLARRRRKA